MSFVTGYQKCFSVNMYDIRTPFEQGVDAYIQNRPETDNPYMFNGLGMWAREWQEGWQHEEKERKDYEIR